MRFSEPKEGRKHKYKDNLTWKRELIWNSQIMTDNSNSWSKELYFKKKDVSGTTFQPKARSLTEITSTAFNKAVESGSFKHWGNKNDSETQIFNANWLRVKLSLTHL